MPPVRFDDTADNDTIEVDIEEFPGDVRSSLNLLSSLLHDRVKIGRRSHKSTFNMTFVPANLVDYFTELEECGLWIRLPTTTPDTACRWYSPFYQAGSILARFDLINTPNNPDGERQTAYCADACIAFPSGDLATLVPPFEVSIHYKKIGKLQRLGYWTFAMDAAIAGVSAGEGGNLTFSEDYPTYEDAGRFIVLRQFASMQDHVKRGVQKTCRHYALPRCLDAMQSAMAWTFKNDPLPNAACSIRKGDERARAGHVWSEHLLEYVKFTSQRHNKQIVQSNSTSMWRRYQEAKEARKILEENVRSKRAQELRDRDVRRANKMRRLMVHVLPEEDDAPDDSIFEPTTASEERWLHSQPGYRA